MKNTKYNCNGKTFFRICTAKDLKRVPSIVARLSCRHRLQRAITSPRGKDRSSIPQVIRRRTLPREIECTLCLWIPAWQSPVRNPLCMAFATLTDFADELSSAAFVSFIPYCQGNRCRCNKNGTDRQRLSSAESFFSPSGVSRDFTRKSPSIETHTVAYFGDIAFILQKPQEKKSPTLFTSLPFLIIQQHFGQQTFVRHHIYILHKPEKKKISF